MKIYSTVFFFCSLFNLYAQQGWENSSTEEFSQAIMAMEQAIPVNESYSYETAYSFYEELESTVPVISDKGILIRNAEGEFYMEQFGKVIVQNKFVHVTIDENSKSIVVKEAQGDYIRQKSAADFSVLQASGSTVQKKVVPGKTLFYVRFPDGFKYAGAEITAGGAMGIEKYILYSQQTTFENTEGITITAQPRMEVAFLNFVQGKKVNALLMKQVSDFIIPSGKGYLPNDKYKDFELIDLRSQP